MVMRGVWRPARFAFPSDRSNLLRFAVPVGGAYIRMSNRTLFHASTRASVFQVDRSMRYIDLPERDAESSLVIQERLVLGLFGNSIRVADDSVDRT